MDAIVQRSRQLLDEVGPLSHGFYTSGQLFIEEYYALAVLGKAGIGTPHMDGNTRLCTATAASALKETFGADGQPGCYDDIDECDAMFLFGHNMAAHADGDLVARARSSRRPRIRRGWSSSIRGAPPTAEKAEVHLAIRPGTNLALLLCLERELLANGWVDDDFVAPTPSASTSCAARSSSGRPSMRPRSAAFAAEDIRRAAEIFGTSRLACYRRCCRASTRRRRRRHPRVRSTTSTCCAG